MPSKPHRESEREGTEGDSSCVVRRAGRANHRRGSVAATCDGYTVSSPLTGGEPVSDVEIRLLLAVLGATIGQILKSDP